MRFGVVVTSAPGSHQGADSAWQFVCAALERGHEVDRVFFYQDGVHNGTRLAVPASDERDLPGCWSGLAADRGVDLVLCVTSARRRGVLDDEQARRAGRSAGNIGSGFRIGGLGQLVEMAHRCDRVITFGR